MIPKYTIEFSLPSGRHPYQSHYSTDDPVTCEEFVSELLDRGMRIKTIRHEGVELPRAEFDRVVKTAAGMLVSKRICASLGIKPDEEHFRFGFAA